MSFGYDLDKRVSAFFKALREQDEVEVEELEEIAPIEEVIGLPEPIAIPELIFKPVLILPPPQVFIPDSRLEEELVIDGITFEERIIHTLMDKARKTVKKDFVDRFAREIGGSAKAEKYVSTFLEKERFLKEFPISSQVYTKLEELGEVRSIFQKNARKEMVELLSINGLLLMLLITSNPLFKSILLGKWSCSLSEAAKLIGRARGTVYKMVSEGTLKIKGEIKGGQLAIIEEKRKVEREQSELIQGNGFQRTSYKYARNDNKSTNQTWEIDLLALCKLIRKRIRMNAGLRYDDPSIEKQAVLEIVELVFKHGFSAKKHRSYADIMNLLAISTDYFSKMFGQVIFF